MSTDSLIPTPDIACPTVSVTDNDGWWAVEILFEGRPVVGITCEAHHPVDPTLVVWDTSGEVVDDAHSLALGNLVAQHLSIPKGSESQSTPPT